MVSVQVKEEEKSHLPLALYRHKFIRNAWPVGNSMLLPQLQYQLQTVPPAAIASHPILSSDAHRYWQCL